MPDPATTTAVTTVAVGILTGSAALFGQWLTQRTTHRQAEATRQAALRLERREAYIEFLEATQLVSRIIEQRRQATNSVDDEQAAALTHRMWLLQKKIGLLADEEVWTAASRFARMFAAAVWEDIDTELDIWAYMDDAMMPFMLAAREDLGTDERDPWPVK